MSLSKSRIHVTPAKLVMTAYIAVRDSVDRCIAVIFGQALVDKWRTISHRVPRIEDGG